MIELLQDPHAWAALAMLTLLEVVLGIDNLVFIAILTDRLPRAERRAASVGWLLPLRQLELHNTACVLLLQAF